MALSRLHKVSMSLLRTHPETLNLKQTYRKPMLPHSVPPKPRCECREWYEENKCDDHEDAMHIDEV